MKSIVTTAAIAVAMAMPSVLLAADDGAMAKPMYMCHVSATSEKPDSMMGSTGLTCAKVDVVKMKAALAKVRAMEDKMDAPTKAQVEALEKMITLGEYGGG